MTSRTSSDSFLGKRSIAIIGGGQAAKAVLFALAEAVAAGLLDWKGCKIDVFERGDEFGTGLAWSRSNALDLHYSSLPSWEERVAYGDGQKRQIHACVDVLGSFGVEVELHRRSAITSLAADEDLWRLKVADGRNFAADAVVLATGHWFGQPVVSGAIHPWPARSLQQAFLAKSGERVTIIGSRLSGVDAALSVAAAAGEFCPMKDGRFSYRANRPLKITLWSNSGSLPGVWGRWPERQSDAELSVRAAFRSLIEETGNLPLGAACRAVFETAKAQGLDLSRLSIDWDEGETAWMAALERHEAERSRDPIATLRAEISRVVNAAEPIRAEELKAVPVQAYLLAILPILSEHFHALNAEDHALFEAHLRGPLYRAVMPLTLPSALRMAALADTGCLQVVKAMPGEAPPEADLFVDATGQSGDLKQCNDELTRDLLRTGIIQPSQRFSRTGRIVEGGGVNVDPATRLVASAAEVPPLYAMGVLTMGLFLDAQGIGHLMRDATALVHHLHGQFVADVECKPA